ncbi:MAG: recombinase family protein [Eubacteriales bacterium]
MPYCLYLRKSRADAEAEAHGEGETLARHERILLELARSRHLEIGQIHREIVSGETIAARPVMQQLLSEVEQEMWEGVLVVEVERLARGDTIDQGIVAQTFKFSGTKIITPSKTYDPSNEFDEEYFEFGLFMSRREYKTINRRLQRGRVASVKEGHYVANQPPYGYDRVKIPGEKGYTLEPIQEEAEVVRMIYEWYTKGVPEEDGTYRRIGVSLIVRRLNELHIKPKRNDHWAVASVRDMLINPIYIGKVRWNWRHNVKRVVDGQVTVSRPRSSSEDCIYADGRHPAIVEKEVWEQAQELMKKNPARPIGERGKVMNPLSGLVVCAKCGKRMVRRPYPNGYPDTLMCADTACDNISSFLPSVESRVLDSLREWLVEYRVNWDEKKEETVSLTEADTKEKALRRLETERETLAKQLDRTHDLLEQGIYTTEQFLDRSRNLSDRIRENEERKNSLVKELQEIREREIQRGLIIPKVEKILSVYDTLTSAKEKNDMLKEVLEKITYLKTTNGRWHNSPDNFQVTIFPRIPTPPKS